MKKTIKIKRVRLSELFDFNKFKYILFFLVYVETIVSKSAISIPHWYTVSTFILVLYDIDVFIHSRKKGKISKLVVVFLAFYSYFAIVTLVANIDDFVLSIMRIIRAVSFIYVVNSLFQNYNLEKALDYLLLGMEVLIYINLLAMVLYPNGLYHTITIGVEERTIKNVSGFIRTDATRVHWLLGHQTTLIRYILPTLVVSYIYSNIRYKKVLTIRSICLICACVVETVIAKSATNYMTLIVFVGVFLFYKFHIRIKWYHVLAFSLVLYTVLIKISDNAALLLVLSRITGRTVKLSTRAPIWLNSIRAWLSSPIFGLGYVNESSMRIRNILGLGNPHSDYLWILFEGGLVGMLMFIAILIEIWKRGTTFKYDEIAMIAYSALICFLVGILTDDYIFREQFYMIVIIICYNIPLFCRSNV